MAPANLTQQFCLFRFRSNGSSKPTKLSCNGLIYSGPIASFNRPSGFSLHLIKYILIEAIDFNEFLQ
jgi:hypothetical protein